MAAKLTADQKKEWEERGAAACKESTKLANQILERAKEQEAAERHLKILESGRDKLINIAEAVYTETEERSEDKLKNWK
jgi:ABC-type branched-subunit amino acid transport system ATPase component